MHASRLPPLLGAEEVHVWTFPLVAPDTGAFDLLSTDEAARAARYRNEPARLAFVCSRVGLRRLLGAYVWVQPREVRFDYAASGKPSLHTDPSLHFSVTHTQDLGAIAVTRAARVGVDVEAIRPFPNLVGVMRSFWHPRLADAVEREPTEAVRRVAFFRAWTAIEAIAKATGDGLALPLAEVDLDLTGETPCILGLPPAAASTGWNLVTFEPSPQHTGAVAVRRADLPVRFFHLE